MNVFTNILLIFIFIYILLYFQLINIENNNYIQHQFLIFIFIFFFEFVVLIISKIHKKCIVDINKIINECLKISVAALIGYVIYIDLTFMDISKDYIQNITNNDLVKYLVITSLVTGFVLIIKLIDMMFSVEEIKCSR